MYAAFAEETSITSLTELRNGVSPLRQNKSWLSARRNKGLTIETTIFPLYFIDFVLQYSIISFGKIPTRHPGSSLTVPSAEKGSICTIKICRSEEVKHETLRFRQGASEPGGVRPSTSDRSGFRERGSWGEYSPAEELR